MKTLLVGWVTSGTVRAEFVRSLLALQITPLEHWSLGGTIDQISSYIDENRNMLVREFLNGTHGDWLLMVDIDMLFNPKAVDEMHAYVEQGEGIIAGIYNTSISTRTGEPTLVPLSYMVNPETDRYHSVKLDSAQYVDGAPAGFLLLSRKALELMEGLFGPHWFTRIETSEPGKMYGEDISFCRRAKQAGLNIMAVPKLGIRHLKIMPI